MAIMQRRLACVHVSLNNEGFLNCIFSVLSVLRFLSLQKTVKFRHLLMLILLLVSQFLAQWVH